MISSMAKTPDPKFKIDQDVYLITDPEQIKHKVLRIVITANGYQYSIRQEGEFVEYYDIELSESKNVI